MVPNQKQIKEGVWLLLTSMLTAWLFFVPIFWDLVGGVQSYPLALKQVFLENNSPEFFIGGGIDQLGTIWVFTMAKGIFMGEHGSILDQIYAPFGFDLGANTGFGWADALLSLPIILLLGTPGFYNAHVFITLTLTMFGMQLLFRMLKAPRLIAFGLGLCGLMTPFVIQEIYDGRPTQVHWFFHSVFLCAVVQSRSPHWKRWALIGGLSLSAACLTYWFGGAAIGFCGAVVLIAQWIIRPNFRQMAFGLLLSVITLSVSLLITARVSIPMLQGERNNLYYQLDRSPLTEIDLEVFTIPIQSMTHLSSLEDFYTLLKTLPVEGHFWWLAPLLIIPLNWRKSIPWLIGFIIAVGIPLTPALHWKGGMLPTGHALFHAVFPPLPRCEFPIRMVVAPLLLMLSGLACLAGRLHFRIHSPIIKGLFKVLLGFMLIGLGLEGRPQSGTVGNFQIDGDLVMATRRTPGGVIDVPLERSQNTYVQQIYHKQPILGGPGMNRVRPDGHEEYVNSSAFLRGLEALAVGENPEPLTDKSVRRIWNDGFRWIVVHTNLSRSDQSAFEEYIGSSGKLDMRTRQLIIPIPKPNTP